MITTFSQVPDPDAAKYIAAVNGTGYSMSTAEKGAITTFISALKQNGLWKRAYDFAIYPLIGNTADSQKFNLLNPVDSDAAFRLTWYGSPTHNTLGVKGNGSSQYVFTHINPYLLGATSGNISLSAWAQESTAYYVAGVYDSGNRGIAMAPSYTDGKAYYVVNQVWDYINSLPASTPRFVNANGSGLFTVTRTTIANQQAYQNGVLVNSDSTVASIPGIPRDTFSLLAVYRDNGSGSASGFTEYSPNTVSFGSIMAGLTSSQAAIFYRAVHALMVALGRA